MTGVSSAGALLGTLFPNFVFVSRPPLLLDSPPPLSRHCRPVLELHRHHQAFHLAPRPLSPPLRSCSEQPRLSPGPALLSTPATAIPAPQSRLQDLHLHVYTSKYVAPRCCLGHDRVFFGTTNISIEPTYHRAIYFHPLSRSVRLIFSLADDFRPTSCFGAPLVAHNGKLRQCFPHHDFGARIYSTSTQKVLFKRKPVKFLKPPHAENDQEVRIYPPMTRLAPHANSPHPP